MPAKEFKTIKKVRINKITELTEGDVIYIFEKRQSDKNATRSEHKLPEINFHRICVVHKIDGEVFHHREHQTLTSTDGSHKELLSLLKWGLGGELLTNGTFGCNHPINEHTEIYKLIDIVDHHYVWNPPNLKGNPGYDLMM
jgi:hypothetical protein